MSHTIFNITVATLFGAIAIAGIAIAQSPPAAPFLSVLPYMWNKGPAIANAKATVESMLTDPSSAQFQSVRTIKGTHGILVCGQVNARNKFGGYVGFSDFVFDDYTKYAKLLTGVWSDRHSMWRAYKDEFSLCGVSEPEFR